MAGIIRAPRPDRGWTEIKNTTARDARLSYRARGILLRLLSNDDGFRMTAEDLAREAREGRSAVLTALRELRDAGYLVVSRIQGEGGRWRTETLVFDTPQTEVQFPDFGSPDSGRPAVGSPDRIKKDQQENQQLKTTTTNSDGSGGGEIEELIEAAVWAESQIEPIRNPGGFRTALFARLAKPGGISMADLDTLRRWRKWRDAREKERQQEASKAEIKASALTGQDAAARAAALVKNLRGEKNDD